MRLASLEPKLGGRPNSSSGLCAGAFYWPPFEALTRRSRLGVDMGRLRRAAGSRAKKRPRLGVQTITRRRKSPFCFDPTPPPRAITAPA